MFRIDQIVQASGAQAWLYLPAALLLGALHGLEPGHSKTMMAAFIIAVRGTVAQAILLGLCAALSHSLLIWLLATLALTYGTAWSATSTEPYLQLFSAVMILGLGLWMAWRTFREDRAAAAHGHSHGEMQTHEHHHHEEGDAHHHHEHTHEEGHAMDYQDAHERAHAEDIRQRFQGGSASTAQIALFGITGGLMPCPAAFTVVLVCLQLKKFALGVGMVLAFSVGLALTLVTVGALAAWSVHYAQKHFTGLGRIARRLPYLSSGVLIVLALYLGLEGWRGLDAH